MIDRSSEQILATSNTDSAIKTLYHILSSRYGFSDDDIELHISHTSAIYLDPNACDDFGKLKAYCRGFVDGFEEAINQHAY